ncbi:nucleoid protein Hbs [Flavobacteriaceae bacterium MAR_2009_75]|nr:nucleoid protein Hbs [Flavobacteriaceae bacterium MAR_2009_75]
MNKSELIDAISKDAGITKIAARKALESLLGNIEKSLKEGDKVSLGGFGSWTVAKRPERKGRNPNTGESIKISSKKVVKFQPGIALQDTDDTGPMKNR